MFLVVITPNSMTYVLDNWLNTWWPDLPVFDIIMHVFFDGCIPRHHIKLYDAFQVSTSQTIEDQKHILKEQANQRA